MEITHVLAGHCWRGDLHGESSEIKPVGKGNVLDQDNYPHFPSLNQSPSVALSEQLTGGKTVARKRVFNYGDGHSGTKKTANLLTLAMW